MFRFPIKYCRLVCSATVLWSGVVPDVAGEAMADQPTPWRITCELRAKSDVSVNPDRLFHSPAAVVAPNGDWLVCYQDSEDHDGLDGVVSQVRSSDQGQTWTSDGIVFDQRGQQRRCLGRNPAYAVTNGEVIVLDVQRWFPAPQSEISSIHGSVYLISQDNGKTYEYRGLVDPGVPLRHLGTTSTILRGENGLMMAGVSISAPPTGITLCTSSDPEKSWQFTGWIFRADQLPVKYFNYGLLARRSDGALLAHCVFYSRNFQCVSKDDGRTWSDPIELQDLRILNNSDLDYAGNVLVAHGRGEADHCVVGWFSPDVGRSWGHRMVLDQHGFRGGGGYSASLRTRQGDLFIVFSTDADPIRHRTVDNLISGALC